LLLPESLRRHPHIRDLAAVESLVAAVRLRETASACNWKTSDAAAAADIDTAAAAAAAAAAVLRMPMLPLPRLDSATSDVDSASRSPGGGAPRSCKDYIPVEAVPDAPTLIPGECEKSRGRRRRRRRRRRENCSGRGGRVQQPRRLGSLLPDEGVEKKWPL
jgi:hypothetical protein